jgi:hypothetical protein
MPVAKENELKRVAAKYAKSGRLKKKKGESTKEAKNAYVYGTLRKIEKRHRAKGGKPGKYLHKV